MTAKDVLRSLFSCLELLVVGMKKPDTFQTDDFSAQKIKSKSHNYLRVFCQLEEPTNGYNRIIKSSPFLISLSNHSLEKFLDFKR